MCGIVGGVTERELAPILMEGLRRLEYRGYDSAGIAVIDNHQQIQCRRIKGKVQELINLIEQQPVAGHTGIAHTRWATHGIPAECNAHPLISSDTLALVHNGIIENHEQLRERLQAQGYKFTSDTDSEIIVHLIHSFLQQQDDLLSAVQAAVNELKGAFALGIIATSDPQRLIAIRSGSPLVVGLGIGENFIASDSLALQSFTQRFIYLEEGDIADITREKITLYDYNNAEITREIRNINVTYDGADRGNYRHFMQKEIFEQAQAVSATLEGRLGNDHVLEEAFGNHAPNYFDKIKRVTIVACGTSYHAGLVARNWLEGLAGIPCQVEVASEYRYRNPVVQDHCLFVTVSQSGETADTLAALRLAKQQKYLASVAVCNVAESSLVRESDIVLLTRAGAEIGVASTKAFTTQLTALLLLTAVLGRRHKLTSDREAELVTDLLSLPGKIEEALTIDALTEKLAQQFADKQHALFLGRTHQYPVALEAALKLKEISYIHAEAYPAGELKHGPLALVDKNMPVIAVAPNDELLEKLKNNLQEVQARGGKLIVYADGAVQMDSSEGLQIINMPTTPNTIAPIIYTVPLQLLAYHVAVIKGTDVDQPRNLAKSVTVE